MSHIVVKDRVGYSVRDGGCIGRPCLKLHAVAIRGAVAGGTRLAGYSNECAQRFRDGCPYPLPEYDVKVAAKRRREGMKSR